MNDVSDEEIEVLIRAAEFRDAMALRPSNREYVTVRAIRDKASEALLKVIDAAYPDTSNSIQLTSAEVQSGFDRVKWAEGLIRQLPESHEGRNSWLLNFGTEETEQ